MLPQLVVTAGLGFPELVHLELGRYLGPSVDLHLRAGAPLLQPAIGLGVRAHLGPHEPAAPPPWAFTAGLDLTFNPTYLHFYEGGEKLGVAAWPMIGVERLADSGFVARVELGALLAFEDRSSGVALGGGPNVRFALGYAWR